LAADASSGDERTARTVSVHEPVEDLASFRLRARQWLAENMPRLPDGADNQSLLHEDEYGVRARELQRRLHEAGFAGLCFPTMYGGRGLTRVHQHVFTEESVPYQMPVLFNVPTLSILATTLLDFGTEEQKRRHLPAIIGGEEIWVQMLSEPSGGSDLAGLITRTDRDGDAFVLNGSKIWTSGAFRADYAMCLARTDWQVPKHRGLTMFIVKIHQPGIEVQRIRRVNGRMDFCQEFFDDVVIPVEDVLGEVNAGWTVASRLLTHEREAAGGGSQYVSGLASGSAEEGGQQTDLIELASATGQGSSPRFRQLVAEAVVNDRVQQQLIGRVTAGIKNEHFPAPAGSFLRLFAALNDERRLDIGLEMAGASGGAWIEGDAGGEWGDRYLYRQGGSLAGGSNEMQRNLISERVLHMPREHAADLDRPFDQVPHNQPRGRG
jgi:alkylation response protein AidB-like acyl-CoA dehydrogenase